MKLNATMLNRYGKHLHEEVEEHPKSFRNVNRHSTLTQKASISPIRADLVTKFEQLITTNQ